MGVALANVNVTEAAGLVDDRRTASGVVGLSMHYDEGYVIRSPLAGPRAYLPKDGGRHELIDAIQTVVQERSYFSPKTSRILQEDFVQLLGRKGVDDSYDLLTEREREVL